MPTHPITNPKRADEDPMVMAAFAEGRAADDIWVVCCGRCEWWSYYNEGSHATCRNLNCGIDLMDQVEAGEALTMADYWTGTPYPCDEVHA